MLLQRNIVKKYLSLLDEELSAQIKATDEEIDNKVFDLYGLTEEERKIVMNTV